MKVNQIKIQDIKPYGNNAKKHSKKQIEQVANSIKRFGFVQPLVVDKNNELIIGHCRLEASKKLGLTEVPVLKVEDLSEEEVKALRLADNKLNESEWDMDIVISELKGLSDDLLDLTGFDKDLIIEPENKDDEVPEVPEEPKSKLGDLYELGNHRVLCGDSTKAEDVERLMDGKKADMVFTDPPYGMNLNADYTSLSWGDRKGKKYDDVIGDREDFKPELITTIFDNFGYCNEIFTWGADYYFDLIPDFRNGNYIVWDKTLESNGDAGSNSEYELLWSKQKHKRIVLHFNWFRYFGLQQQDIKKRMHPTQKPLQVCEPIIKEYSKDLNIIIDLYLGVGSTLIACEKTNRVCYGMEIDPKYIDVVVQRYVDYTGNNKIKLNGKEIIW